MEKQFMTDSTKKNVTNTPTIRVHKVGTITLGISLIVFGCLFLAHTFYPALNYEMIFHTWPIIFILLGLEVLLSSKENGFIIEKSAIFLLIILTFFAMGMGITDYCIEVSKTYINQY